MLRAVGFYLCRMAGEGSPTLDLDGVNFRQPTAKKITTIPLEPAARIWTKDPTIFLPYAERLSAFDFETV